MMEQAKFSINYKRIAVAILIIAGIFVAAWLIFDSIFPRMVLQGENLVLSAGARQTFEHDNMALLVGNDGLTLVNRRSEVVWSANERFSAPFVSVNGEFILYGSRRGQNAVVFRNRREVYRVETAENITLGRVNRNGYAAVVTTAEREVGVNGIVVIFDRAGDEIFRWRAGAADNNYIINVDIAPNGREIAIAKLVSDGAAVASTVTIVDIARSEVIEVIRRENSLIGAISYNRSGDLLAVSDTELLGLHRDGRIRFEVPFNGRRLLTFNTDSENAVVLGFYAGRDNVTVEIYSRDGRLRGTYHSQGQIRNLTVSGDVILASRFRTVVRIMPNGRAEQILEIPYDIHSLQVMGDGRHALIIGGANANVIRF